MRRLVLALAIALLSTPSLLAAIPQSERDALIAFYQATGGDNWTNNDGWLGAPGTECSWYGVSCDSATTTVTMIRMTDNKLNGQIPSALASLVNLQVLEIYLNQLSGPLPDLSTLQQLVVFDLGDNQLVGSIPEWLASLPALEVLAMSRNQLTGALPAALGERQTLTTLHLAGNKLTGTVPAALGNLTNLTSLDLSSNTFEGPIPPSLGNLSNLQYFDLQFQSLSGPIPDELGNLSQLEVMNLAGNQLSGPIPTSLGNLSNLRQIALWQNNLSGPIPEELGNLSKLENLWLDQNQLTGSIPASFGNLRELRSLGLNENKLTGPLPSEIGNLSNLEEIYAGGNGMTGPLPPELGNLSKLRTLSLWDNAFTGSLPPELGNLVNLESLSLVGSNLTGEIPPELGNLTKLVHLNLWANELTGEIPKQLGNLTKLQELKLADNHLSGPIPEELSALVDVVELRLGANKLQGAVPVGFKNLPQVETLDLSYNALRADDPALIDWIVARDEDFLSSQTTPPSDVTVTVAEGILATFSWSPIAYQSDPGFYEIQVATSASGPWVTVARTPDKFTTSELVTSLNPGTNYFARMRTVTTGSCCTRNTVESEFSPVISFSTSSAPLVGLTRAPDPIIQAEGESGGTTSYVLTNFGTASTTVTLSQDGSFFTQSPASFLLEAGASQTVTITGGDVAPGSYRGASLPTGDGVPGDLKIPVNLLVAAIPAGEPNVITLSQRVDAASAANTNPTGTARFQNVGNATATGIVVSDVPWIIPEEGVITIEPGAIVDVGFTIDRSQRPDGDAPIGSQTGSLIFVYLTPGSSKGLGTESGHNVSTTLVTIVDTAAPPVEATGVPPLDPGEVAIFVPGVGHVVGSVGLFLSDLTLASADGSALGSVEVYYTPMNAEASSGVSTAVSSIGAGTPLSLADVVNTVFGEDAQLGTLQIRGADAASMSVVANILAVSDPSGTFGTTIPAFRSWHGVRAGLSQHLTGLTRTPTTHTNLFIQEVWGGDAAIDIEYRNAEGVVVGSTSVELGPFELTGLFERETSPVLPEGAVSATLTNGAESTGAFVAYATPVDRGSGDFWSVVDWNNYYGYMAEPVLIPIAGSVFGANDTFFRTDAAIAARDSTRAAGLLRYHPRGGSTVETTITLESGESAMLDDVVTEAFDMEVGTLGHIVFEPEEGAFTVTSRTYTSALDDPASYGTGVATIPLTDSLTIGESRSIGGIIDSSIESIQQSRGGTFRSNFALIETGGAPVTVRVTLHYSFAAGLANARGRGSRDYTLAPNELKLLTNIAREILGETRDDFGDFHNLQADFEVIDGEGAVAVWISSIDNGTGDSILRTD